MKSPKELPLKLRRKTRAMSDNLPLTDEDRKAVEKAIGEPFMDDFSENTLRIRRNLIAAASIGLIFKLGNMKISADSSLFDIKLDGLTSEKVDWILFIILAYLFIHFLWNSFSHFQEWKLRLTGSNLTFQTSSFWGSDYDDSPMSPRQSTLYVFLMGNMTIITELQKQLDEIKHRTSNWEDAVEKRLEDQSTTNFEGIIKPHLDSLNDVLKRITQKLNYLNRIPISLCRFEKSFKLFHWGQSARWLVLEWLLPLGLGLWSIYLVFPYSV